MVEEGVRFLEIDDIELNLKLLGRVLDSKEEPLGIAIGVNVVLQDEVVLGV